MPWILQLKPEWSNCAEGVDFALAMVVPSCYFISAILFVLVGCVMKDEPAVLSEETIYLTYETSEFGDTASEKSYTSSRRLSGSISEAL